MLRVLVWLVIRFAISIGLGRHRSPDHRIHVIDDPIHHILRHLDRRPTKPGDSLHEDDGGDHSGGEQISDCAGALLLSENRESSPCSTENLVAKENGTSNSSSSTYDPEETDQIRRQYYAGNGNGTMRAPCAAIMALLPSLNVTTRISARSRSCKTNNGPKIKINRIFLLENL